LDGRCKEKEGPTHDDGGECYKKAEGDSEDFMRYYVSMRGEDRVVGSREKQ